MITAEPIEDVTEISSEWMPQDSHLELMVWAIVQTIKKNGRWVYREVSSGMGDWDELVHELYKEWGQFGDEMAVAKNKYRKMEQIAEKLAKRDEAYTFMMPDGTDGWYYAYCKPAVFRINHEGELT